VRALAHHDERPISLHTQFMADAVWRSEPAAKAP
jgi:hypothetical protein